MNERIKDLAKRAGFQPYITTHPDDVAMFEQLVKLVGDDLTTQLNEKWYELNDIVPPAGEGMRELGIRIGQKNGLLKAIDIVRKNLKEHNG